MHGEKAARRISISYGNYKLPNSLWLPSPRALKVGESNLMAMNSRQ